MSDLSVKQQLYHHLAGSLGKDTATDLVTWIAQGGGMQSVVELLGELHETSGKIFHVAIEALSELNRRCEPEIVVPWLDLGISLAGSSGALSLKYLKESPLILGVMNSAQHRQRVLALTLELADRESDLAPNCALDFFKKAPELLMVVPDTDLEKWAEIGLELAEWNPILGMEFFRECPQVAEVLAITQVRDWITFGTKLITQNTLGKPDYVGTLEFFRSSPGILKEVPEMELRSKVVMIGSTLSDRSPRVALAFLADVPKLLRTLPSEEWRLRYLQYGGLLAERDAEVTLAYLRQCPEILRLTGPAEAGHSAFETWFRSGMEILEYSPEGARAYFALETGKALLSVEQAMNGVPLRQVARSLKLLSQMLCGEDVKIQSLPESEEFQQAVMPHRVSGPGVPSRPGSTGFFFHPENKTLFLPGIVNRFPTRDQNFRFYVVMTAHEVGHVEFGTYRVNLGSLQELGQSVQARYHAGGLEAPLEPLATLADLFNLYPQKGVIRDLWMMVEDARVDHHLQQEYPGLREDFHSLTKDSVRTRSFLHGMTVREMVLDYLLLHFASGPETVQVSEDLEPVVNQAWSTARNVLQPHTTPEDSVRIADRVYQILDEMIGKLSMIPRGEQSPEEGSSDSDLGPGPRAGEEISKEYRPITNWAYRGILDPEMIEAREETLKPSANRDHVQEGLGNPEHVSTTERSPGDMGVGENMGEHAGADDPGGSISPSIVNQWLTVTMDQKGNVPSQTKKGGVFFYDEWDGAIQDYRTRWCRVLERSGPEGSQDFANATLETYGSTVRLLRRYFETIRPTALCRIHGQEDGEEVDLDAAITRAIHRRVGAESDDRVYIRRDKRARQVAAAFLIDMSGSTGRQIASDQRRVIDVEKEGLVLLTEALEAIGDQYAVYGFSGQGRNHVDFVVLKDFEESLRYRVEQRIEAVIPLQQNRDGAAIRHAVWKLLQCPARHRLLVLMSDGKPLDEGYGEEYALEDTKMALREARLAGVRPFCLTIDRDANNYLRRMYGEVGYLILDDVGALPERLPRIYQRLTAS